MALENGTKVRVHYRGTLDDGTEFDNSFQRGEPIEFEVGGGSVISGFDDAVRGLDVGGKLSFRIASDDAYGPQIPEAIQTIPRLRLPEGAEVGLMVHGTTEEGQPLAGTITALDDANATVDFNHPLAGEDLNFEVELVEIVE